MLSVTWKELLINEQNEQNQWRVQLPSCGGENKKGKNPVQEKNFK